MKRLVLFTFAGLVASACLALAQPRIDGKLFFSVRQALPRSVSTNEILRALDGGLWDSNKVALAVVIERPKGSLIFVFLRQANGQFLAADVSGVEGGNFGKLGTTPRSGYDRFETTPTQWLNREDGLFQVVMRTRAWKSGQRYTVSEPLVIRADGTPLYR